MRPAIWILLYVLSILLMLPAFSAILYAKEATQNTDKWTTDAHYRREAKVRAWSTAVILAPIWPISLVGMGVYMIFRAFEQGLPKEVRQQLKRRQDREIIRQYDEEQIKRFEE